MCRRDEPDLRFKTAAHLSRATVPRCCSSASGSIPPLARIVTQTAAERTAAAGEAGQNVHLSAALATQRPGTAQSSVNLYKELKHDCSYRARFT